MEQELKLEEEIMPITIEETVKTAEVAKFTSVVWPFPASNTGYKCIILSQN